MVTLSKYHGLGNDFIIGKFKDVSNHNHSELAKTVCDRHSGVGADGLILVKEDPLEMIYYNSDGSRAKMCGNGIRCFAKYVIDEGMKNESSFNIFTLAGIMKVDIIDLDPFMVEVNMGMPDFDPTLIPSTLTEEIILKDFRFQDESFTASSLLLGVPHTCVEVDRFPIEEMVRVGRLFEESLVFPEGTNVNFFKQISSNEVKMQTFERGAGLTLACGTGACAVYALLRKLNRVEQRTKISLPLGDLYIRDYEDEIYMTGPAVKVCDVTIEE